MMKRKVLAMILALVMVIGLLPMAALAAERVETPLGEEAAAGWRMETPAVSAPEINHAPVELLEDKSVTLTFPNSTANTATDYPATREGNTYTVTVPDSVANFYVKATLGADLTGTIKATYTKTNGSDGTVNLTAGKAGSINQFLAAGSLEIATLTVTVTPGEGDPIVLTVNVIRELTLSALSIEGYTMDEAFANGTTAYTVDVPASVETLTFAAEGRSEGTSILYNGASSPTVNVSGITAVTIKAAKDELPARTYTVTLNKITPFAPTVTATPNTATVALYDKFGILLASGTGSAAKEGVLNGTYTVTAPGYKSQTGTLTDGMTGVTLEEAPAPATPLPDYTGDWVSFRGNEQNMGITNAQTPILPAETQLKWAVKLGTGWSAAPTPPIIVNGDLYILSGSNVYRVNKETGETLATSEALGGSAGFALNPITYGGGMLFVQIGNGKVQALRADTLESVWISEQMADKGQTLCPITYHNGYIYTGTWKGESANASYFCISVTDEDPTNKTETKLCTWKRTHMGGHYWAGAYATDDYVIYGSDDGTPEGDYSANGVLYSVAPTTGELLDKIENIKGDIRSTVSYDIGTDRVYCTTKGGLLIQVKVNADGTFDKSTYKTLELGGMSTGTPLVYEGLLFVGVSGEAQFGEDGHKFKVIDTDTLTVETIIPTLGYVQTSSLLTTGYVSAESKKIYIYYTYNNNPGGIDYLEYDLTTKTSTSGHLFVPPSNMQQYCICSLVCDADGTLYYKNDSGNVMAVRKHASWAESITVDGTAVTGFDPTVTSYEVVLPRDKTAVTVAVTGNEGSTVTINDEAVSAKEFALSADPVTVTVTTTKGDDSRAYTLTLRWASNVPTAIVLLSTSNGCSGTKVALNGDVYLATQVGNITNIWLGVKDGSTVDPDSFTILKGGETPGFTEKTSGNTNGSDTYMGYWRNGSYDFPITASFTVTAEDGVTSAKRYIVITKDTAYTPDTGSAVVTIVNKGAIVMAQREVTVTDQNYDGKFNLDEVLYAAHELAYPGGAAAGYASGVTQYGLSLQKLWGDTSFNFGYYIDDGYSMGLADEVESGHRVNAYVNANPWGGELPMDIYAHFNEPVYTAAPGHTLTVILKAAADHDDNYLPVFSLYKDAAVTAYNSDMEALDAEAYTVVNRNNGSYEITFRNAGTYFISATAENNAIVPPVSKVTVAEAPTVAITFETTPASAVVTVTKGGQEVPATSGKTYDLAVGERYGYTVTASGYIAKSGSVTPGDQAETITVTLTEAQPSTDPTPADPLKEHRTKALASLKAQYDKYNKKDYTDENWAALKAAYDAGVAAINSAEAAAEPYVENNIVAALNAALAAMKAIPASRVSKITVAVSMDANTLGLGYLIKPTLVEVDNYTSASVVITNLLLENDYTWDNTGSIESGFYLAEVSPVDQSGVVIPEYITSAVAAAGGSINDEDKADDALGEFDYFNTSGWMYSVDGSFPGVGSADWTMSDGEVMRWQFTVFGLGADLNANNASWGGASIVNVGNKDALTWLVARLRSQYEDSVLNANSAYTAAMDVLTDPTASQSEINSAKSALERAYSNNAGTTPAAPTTPTAPTTPEEPSETPAEEEKTVEVKPEVIVDKSGTATADVSEETVDAALTEAAKDEDTAAIVISPEVSGEADKVAVELPMTAVEKVADTDLDVTVKTDIAEITISNEGLTALAQEEGETLSVSAQTVKDEEGSPTGEVKIEVAVGDKTIESVSGGLSVTLPAQEESGNVLVIVDAEGNETIVKKSVVEDGAVAAILEGSCTVKVVDNSKTFTDMDEAPWAEEAVGFAASHELFNGTSESTFSPRMPMDRAMLATVLFRLEDAAAQGENPFEDVSEGTWYTDAVVWAAEAGIVTGDGTGFAPHRDISRQEIVVMLFRYAKTIGMDTAVKGDLSKFEDAGEVADWASDAMAWAVGTGLIGGKTPSTLAPIDTASRAEVAAILQRLVKLMVK